LYRAQAFSGKPASIHYNHPSHSMPPLASAVRAAEVVVPCSELQPALDFFVERLGFRVDAIFPADAPSTAVISGHGVRLRLSSANDQAAAPSLRLLCDLSALPAGTPRELTAPNGMKIELVDANPPIELPEGKQEFVISRLAGVDAWGTGRAAMQYRDLVPSRLGGRFVASHIRIPAGGPVPDYVHYHRVRFQMIFCKAGWVRVVYEDQGPPFVLHAGDCVLQPPEIRHRVLEASPGLEVIEIGCPAMHETFADHDLVLPNDKVDSDRVFSGQRFVRHVAASASWSPWKTAGFEARDIGIAAATGGLAGVRVVRSSGAASGTISHDGEFLFFFVLHGELGLRNHSLGSHQLRENESCVIPAGAKFELTAKPELEVLEVHFSHHGATETQSSRNSSPQINAD
jgi:quercetin dioxygenase-like cupin family protein